MRKIKVNKNIFIGGGKNIVGYCKLHHNTLTPTQMRGRKCLAKGCHHFRKNLSHPYWKQREIIKQRKKEKGKNGKTR